METELPKVSTEEHIMDTLTYLLSPQWTLAGHKGWVLCVEWDAREKIVATGGHDGQVSLQQAYGH
jgi:WD40 repeat protein